MQNQALQFRWPTQMEKTWTAKFWEFKSYTDVNAMAPQLTDVT